MPEAVEIPEWHKQELEELLDAYHAKLIDGSPWQDVKKRILGRSANAHRRKVSGTQAPLRFD
jgi:hypothetical protein